MVTFLFTLFGQNLSKIIHISRLGNEKSWRNLDIKVWYIFVGLLLNFNSYNIFHAISLEQTWKLLETCISTLEKDCEFFIIALYYKSTHLQNSGRDHAQWHKPLGSTLIWLANIIVHCQSCQRRSQDSFVELKFLRLFEVLRVLKLVSSEVLSVNIQHQAYLRVQAEGGQQKMQLLACDSIPTYTPLNSSSSSISNVSKEINTSNLLYCFCLQWA